MLFSNHTYKIDKTIESPAFDQAIGIFRIHIDRFTTADTEGEQREQTWVVGYLLLPGALPFAAISLSAITLNCSLHWHKKTTAH